VPDRWYHLTVLLLCVTRYDRVLVQLVASVTRYRIGVGLWYTETVRYCLAMSLSDVRC